MELQKKKLNGITWKLIVGILIFLVVNTLIQPDFWVVEPVVSFIQSALSVLGWGLLISAASKLYEDNVNGSITRLQILSSIGIVFYSVLMLFWMIASVSPTPMIRFFITGVTSLAFPGKEYEWCLDIRECLATVIIVLKGLICINVIGALNASVGDEYKLYKRFNIIGYFNLIYVVGFLLMLFSNKYHIDELRLFFVGYIIFLILYIIYMRKYLNISLKRKNGSIFNRIPEEDYQEFLEKMK